LEILTVDRVKIFVTESDFVATGQTIAEIWRFNGFQNCGRLLSWIFKIS